VNDYLAPRPEMPTLARTLRESGYETAAFVSHVYTSRAYGFDDGFDVFEDFGLSEDYAFDQGREPRAERVVGAARGWLAARDDERPFLLLLHLFDPHWDYAAPEPFRTRFDPDYTGSMDGSYGSISRFFAPESVPEPRDLDHLAALYDGEIAYTDACLDSLLRFLDREGLGERTAIVLAADHGEEFREHGSMGHSFSFFDEVLRVPLLLHEPGAKTGTVEPRPVSLLDVFPTVARIAGAAIPAGLQGRPLDGSPGADSPFLEAGTIREGRYGRAVQRGPLKLVWDAAGYRLYDRSVDGGETNDLLAGRPPGLGPSSRALLERMEGSDGNAGWHVLWKVSEGGGACAGTVDPEGIVTDLLPVGGSEVRISAEGNGSFDFRSGDDGGFRFQTAPSGRSVRFRLRLNNQEDRGRIFVGRQGFHPPSAAFGLDPSSSPPDALAEPALQPERPHITVWRGAEIPSPPVITVTDAEKERLRALGYLGEP
jgi:hypothetical protein